MVNKILNSISVALHDFFGDDYHYYVEDVKQHLKLPCFTIDVLQPLSRAFKVNKYQYFRTMPCIIHSFTSNKVTTKNELYGIGEQALEALEYITVDDHILRGNDMSFQIVEEDVLEVFITYRFYTLGDNTDEVYMEDLEVDTIKPKSLDENDNTENTDNNKDDSSTENMGELEKPKNNKSTSKVKKSKRKE